VAPIRSSCRAAFSISYHASDFLYSIVFDSLELGAIVVQLDGETESNVDAGWLLKNRRYQTALTCFSQGVDVGKVCVLY
jgi:hypothetical protein